MSRPGLPEIVLHQDLIGGSRVSGDGGGGRFDVASERGGLCLAAPDLPECSPSTCA
jgi:AraC family transcriptional regulator